MPRRAPAIWPAATALVTGAAAMKRLIEPAEVAELVSYRCRPESSLVTVSAFVLDGDWTAH